MSELRAITNRVLARLSQVAQHDEQTIQRIIQEEFPELPLDRRLKAYRRIAEALSDSESQLLFKTVDGNCDCNGVEQHCREACAVDAISRDEHGRVTIAEDKCVECGLCVDACEAGAIVEKAQCRELVTMMQKRSDNPLYAILAPAFVGQFGEDVSPAQIKAALRLLGFSDVHEVALAADAVTKLEADEYLARRSSGEQFLITSCCCPAFIKLVEKHRPKLSNLVSEAVSPMIALGRSLKHREPHCKVVFIGPCLAKRAESRRPELRDAIDTVLTFKETDELFRLANINLSNVVPHDDDVLFEASRDGRIYAHTGGVTEAIRNAVSSKDPRLEINALIGNGLKQCNQILGQIEAGEADGNFMEGMGCPGGCVGGPGTIVPVADGASRVKRFAKEARAKMARDNELADEWFSNLDHEDLLLSPKK